MAVSRTAGRIVVELTADNVQFLRSLSDSVKHIDKQTRKMRELGNQLTMRVTLPLVAMGAAAAKTAIDFESAFAGVRKTVNATESEFKAIENGIRQMSREVPASVEAIASVVETAGQLGIAKGYLLSFSRTMIDLGESTNLSATEGAQALARFANITQMSQADFSRLGSVIVGLGNTMATTEAEIVQMGLRLAGAGKQVGMTEGEILALAASLSSLGIEADAGGSAMSKSIVTITQAVYKGGSALDTFAKTAGMSAGDFAKAWRESPAQALVAFINGLQRVKAEGGNLFGVLESLGLSERRVSDAMTRAAGAGGLLNKALEAQAKLWGDATALEEEASRRYGTTASKLKMVWNSVRLVAEGIGEALIPLIRDFANFLNEKLLPAVKKWVEDFKASSDAGKILKVSLIALAAAAGPLLKLATNVIILSNALKGLWATKAVQFAVASIGVAGSVTAGLAAIVGYGAVTGGKDAARRASELNAGALAAANQTGRSLKANADARSLFYGSGNGLFLSGVPGAPGSAAAASAGGAGGASDCSISDSRWAEIVQQADAAAWELMRSSVGRVGRNIKTSGEGVPGSGMVPEVGLLISREEIQAAEEYIANLERLRDVGRSIANSLGDAFADFATGGKDAFKNFADYAIKQLIRLAAQMAIVDPIIKMFGASSGGSLGVTGTTQSQTGFDPYIAPSAPLSMGATINIIDQRTGALSEDVSVSNGAGGSIDILITDKIATALASGKLDRQMGKFGARRKPVMR